MLINTVLSTSINCQHQGCSYIHLYLYIMVPYVNIIFVTQ